MIKWKKMVFLAVLSAAMSVLAVMPAAAKPVVAETATDKKKEQTRMTPEDDTQAADDTGKAENKNKEHIFVKVREVLEEQGLLYSLGETAFEKDMETTREAEVKTETKAGTGDAGTVSVEKVVEDISETVVEDTSAIADAKEALLGFGLEESAGDSAPAENSESPENIVPPEDSTPAEVTEPAVIDEAGEADEGTISVPDHPIAQTAEKMVFIGDSRTVDIMNAVHDGSVWACKVSMGYQWMATVGVPAVDSYIDAGTAVIILMGVNDPYNISNYIGYTNEKAAEWAARGATTYFVSVGPVDGDPYVTNAEIESFNAALQANLSGVYYIDIYSYLMANGFSTVDGTHYPDNVSIAIYNYIVEHLEVNRTGIWG